MNYPKKLINETNFYIQEATEEEKARLGEYSKARENFYKNNHGSWTHWYRDGKEGNSGREFVGSEKVSPKIPKVIK